VGRCCLVAEGEAGCCRYDRQDSYHPDSRGVVRLTGALLDRLTHHVHILELNGESYRLKQSKARRRRAAQPSDEEAVAADPETGEIISAS
jgi:hypothetical protein